MRIAFAMINCNRRDGSARPVNEVAERLARAGHEIHLYARTVEDLDLQSIRWHRVPGPGWPEVADFSTYHAQTNFLLANHRYDIVHSIGCNTSRADVVTIQNIQPAKREASHRFAAGERISKARRFTRWLYDLRTSAAEHSLYTRKAGSRQIMFLPVSKGVERELRNHYRIGDSLVRIVPNAADTKRFHPLSKNERAEWRVTAGVRESATLAIFSGGEWARKGLDLAIRSLAHPDASEITLFVAGDDPGRDRFRALAREAGVSQRVIFGGFRKDIATAMGAADLFLFPSHYEAFSLATIEAAACGLPVLVPRINGAEDFIIPGINGEFINHDPAGIAAVLGRLARDPLACETMGRANRKIVEETYTWDHVAAETEAAYRALIDARTVESGNHECCAQ